MVEKLYNPLLLFLAQQPYKLHLFLDKRYNYYVKLIIVLWQFMKRAFLPIPSGMSWIMSRKIPAMQSVEKTDTRLEHQRKNTHDKM